MRTHIGSRRSGCALLAAAWLATSVAVFATIYLVPFWLFSVGMTRQPVVGTKIPRLFPVLVVSREPGGGYAAGIASGETLRLFLKKVAHDQTYLVPEGKDAELNRLVSRAGAHTYYVGRFDVQRLADGRQLIKVTYNWHEGHNHVSGWYVASARSVAPRYQAFGFRGPLYALLNALLAATASCCIWAVVGVALIVRGRVRKRHAM